MDESGEKYLNSIIQKRLRNNKNHTILNASLLNSQYYGVSAHKQNVRVHTLHESSLRQGNLMKQSKVGKAAIEYMTISRRIQNNSQSDANTSINNITFAKRKGLKIFNSSTKEKQNIEVCYKKRRKIFIE